MSKQQIREALGKCDPDEPLSLEDPRRGEFDDLRGVKIQRNLIELLKSAEENPNHRFAHIPLPGHMGCGKSTELNAFLSAAEKERYLVLFARVNRECDPNKIVYSDILNLMTRMLVARFHAVPELQPLEKNRVENVFNWFSDVTKISVKEVETGLRLGGNWELGGDVRVKASAGILGTGGEMEGGLGKLLGYIGLLRKSTDKKSEELRDSLERYPQELVDNLNLLLDDAQRAAKKAGFAGIIFVLDDVDKYPSAIFDETFIKHSPFIKSVNAHLVFTVNISVLYQPGEDAIENRYLMTQTLPMIPVFTKTPRETNPKVIDRLVDTIYKRAPRELFADETLVRRIACLSGGCPRDLLRLLGRSLLNADEVVDEQNVNDAIKMVRAEIARPISFAEYDILAKVHLDGRISPDETVRKMLRLRYILEYNGEGWMDAHPLLQLTTEFRQALAKELAKRHLPAITSPLCA